MDAYQITSRAGVDFGVYQAETAVEALAKCHNDAGYDVHVDDEGELVFKNEDDERLCGRLADWHVEKVDS